MFSKKWLDLLSVLIFAGVCLGADNKSTDAADLRRDLEEIKAIQRDIQKQVKILGELLRGKQPPLENVFIDIANRPALGERNARVAVVEFTDFQCPFCAVYAHETFKRITSAYIDTGKIRYISRNFPLEQIHPLAEKAAEASLCAQSAGKFWEAHARFFADQKSLAMKDMPAHAGALSLDAGAFLDCINNGKYASVVDSDLTAGEGLGIHGTPTFFVGIVDRENPNRVNALKSLEGNVPFREFQKAIDDILAQLKSQTE